MRLLTKKTIRLTMMSFMDNEQLERAVMVASPVFITFYILDNQVLVRA